MKKLYSTAILVCVLIAVTATASFGQKKADLTNISAYSGPIIQKKDPSQGAKLSNLFNMKMHQSISASVGSWGGRMTNTIAFTNSMRFFFTPKLTGQVNLTLLTSPFSQLNIYGFQDNRKLQFALDARLNYEINKHMDIRLEFRKMPRRYGYYPGAFYNPYGVLPYQYGPVFEH